MALQHAAPVHRGVAHHQPLAHRADAVDHLGTGQVERQERLEVLLVRHPSDMEEHRPRQPEVGLRHRREQAQVDAVGPRPQVGEPVFAQQSQHAFGGHHHPGRGCMETAEPGIAPTLGNAQALGEDVRKAGVEGGGEGPAAAQTVRPRGAAERPFGGDVHHVGSGLVELPRHAPARTPGEFDLAVTGAGKAPEDRGFDQHHLVAAPLEPVHQFDQRGDHAVDLGQPCIGDECDLHAACRSVLAARCLAAMRASSARADQSTISSRPSACSARAVRLSTQSPSLA